MIVVILAAAGALWLLAYALTAVISSLPAAGRRWTNRRALRSTVRAADRLRLEDWAADLHALNASLMGSWRAQDDRSYPDDDRPVHGHHRSGAQHLVASSVRFRVEYSAEYGGYRPVAVVAS